MEFHYTQERNVQILLGLLKAYGINKVVASPGSTDITFIASVQYDNFFKVYSCVDERSAAYMACGLADEKGEPVVIVCTGATASRNYVPGLTEAYYRKLPVIAVTTSEPVERIGHLLPQLMDRTNIQNDIAIFSCNLQNISSPLDEWSVNINANKAISALFRNGGGPVHINLETCHNMKFDVMELPSTKVIRRYTIGGGKLPSLPKGRIAVFIGAHHKMSTYEIEAIDKFCKTNNAIVIGDKTSRYTGEFRLSSTLIGAQINGAKPICGVDLLVHIGEVCGDYPVTWHLAPKSVWRVSPDGEMRDTFSKLTAVFEMEEKDFFDYYSKEKDEKDCSYYRECRNLYDTLYNKIPDLPFSNLWIAQHLAPRFPKGSTLHLGILSSLRAYNFFDIDKSVDSISNTGGFGIDGCMSTLIGASLANPDKLYYGVFGDLAFFYDLNSIGNRHVGHNVRIMLVNNGRGGEFRNYNHGAYQFGEATDEFISAGGHNGNQSHCLMKHVTEDLGFKYITASDKDSFYKVYEQFITSEIGEQPIFFEVFTDVHDESNALKLISSLGEPSAADLIRPMKSKAKQIIKDVIPPIVTKQIKKLRS